MTPEEWRKIREILEQALETSPKDRPAFLEMSCAGDPSLRHEVESLIASNEQARSGFLESSALHAAAAAVTSPDVESLTGKRIGSYQIIEEIGHGGMGTVYLAIRADDHYRKQVAIKLVRGGLGDAFRMHRFKAERQILADLDHPNIARLLDGGALDDGQPYVVMEFVQGVPIDEYCNRHDLTVSERLALFRTVCSAVAYAHQRLVIHRDIKPANILVTEQGEPKLLDFGIAKIVDPEELAGKVDSTVTLLRLMTPEYASPEQVRGEPMTTASDVYSLGVVLYGLLTGQRPYPGGSGLAHEIAQAVCESQPQKPSTAVHRAVAVHVPAGKREKLHRRLRGDLDNIVLKALRKEPERRYASVEQFSEDIGRHLAGLPVIARPDTFWYRTEKFVKRHAASVTAAAVVALMLVAGLAITLRAAYIARAERARAEQRFNDVRKLANSLLFEVHDAIQNLPGSTAARKLIVDRALQYLDALANEAKGNLPLQRELAAAYQRVGDVQGGFRAANLGDTSGSLKSYRTALSILASVATADPNNVAVQRELIHAHGKLSDVLLASGDRMGSLEQLRQLVPIAEKLSAADPGNQGERRNLALAYLDYGWKRASRNDWQAALLDCRKSTGLLESVVAADPSDKRSKRALVLAYSRLGDLLSRYARDHHQSLTMHEKALEMEHSMLAQDPHNTDLRRIGAWELVDIGDEMSAGGDVAGALENYRAALQEFQAVAAADPNDIQVHVSAAMAMGHLGAALLVQGNPKLAMVELQKSLAECGRLAKPNTINTDLRWATAFNQFQLGKTYSAMAADAKRPAGARRDLWRQAQLWCQRSLPGLAESKNGAFQELAEDTLREAENELSRSAQESRRLSTIADRPRQALH